MPLEQNWNKCFAALPGEKPHDVTHTKRTSSCRKKQAVLNFKYSAALIRKKQMMG